MRTFIERVDARSNADVVKGLERWKAMKREGWELTVLHVSTKPPTLIAFGFSDADDEPTASSARASASSEAPEP